MPPLGLPLRREWVGQRGKIDPVALAAIEDRLDDVGGAINRLRNLRPKLDKRVWPYLDALVNYGEILRGVILNPIRSGARADDFRSKASAAAQNIQSAKQSLLADPRVVEELGL